MILPLLILLFLIMPIAEIYVLLSAGSQFGVLPVIMACLFTAVLGGILLRMQGVSALNKAQHSMRSGKVPVESAVDGVLLLVSAPFLMTPGFLTDAGGFLLLVPAVRRAIGRYALHRLKAKIDRGEAGVTINRF
ncbi:MAG: FxsA family protein [Pseudomonadota bacterium]